MLICTSFEPLAPIATNPCQPSNCGPYSQCRVANGVAICSCLPNYIGTPPSCRPECQTSSECSQNEACINQRCLNPCPGSCSSTAKCQVINHAPICACPSGQTGNPFIRCYNEVLQDTPLDTNPCQPSPCGPYSQCRNINDQASCSCLPNMIGHPPNCRPECLTNNDCSAKHSCMNQKCIDPCIGACSINAECRVVGHIPMCHCRDGFIGDPFSECNEKQQDYSVDVKKPCSGNPCGVNAYCKEQNGVGACVCMDDFTGNPYDMCRPQCILNSDCPSHLACVKNKCKNNCDGTCGLNADCQMINHNPVCNCIIGYTGDPYRHCQYQRDERKPLIKIQKKFKIKRCR